MTSESDWADRCRSCGMFRLQHDAPIGTTACKQFREEGVRRWKKFLKK